ncbi:cytochrome P450 2U1-like [Saccoglossus kowalevskii]|uniref:Cytochrome P450 2U1-like n=1 Tax=Saccoglossus kowalevskii TaxID=10224 RepID=A0ABM0GZ61_SACKO|nr:PREDICTED: cytochrome P450 2U1-like [Saccoglossus kowalevskii]
MLQIILILAIAAVTFYLLLRKPPGLPHGPPGWPIIGSLFNLGTESHVTLTNLASTYGNVYSIQLGLQYCVVLCGYDVIKEAFVQKGEHFAGRPSPGMITKVLKKAGYIFQDYGPVWKEQRKFALSAFRSFGVGKKSLEAKIHMEIDHLVDYIAKENGHPLDVSHVINNAASNIICSISFGTRYEYSDEVFHYLLHIINEQFRIDSGTFVGNFLPFLIDLPFMYREYKQINAEIHKFIFGKIEEHRATFDPDNMRDFIDMYLSEMERQHRMDAKIKFTDFLLYRSIRDLFVAGTETTTTTLLWGLLYMVTYPDIQKKIHAELDDNVGHDRLPCLEDKRKLPYLEATIMEIQRMANVAALSRHCTTRDTEFHDYVIPQGTLVYLNIWSAHFDQKHWKEPYKFQPERFIGDDGKVVKQDAFIPFGTGRRICLGEQLAKMELFLFFSALLQQFKFTIPEGGPTPSLKARVGITLTPHPFNICAIRR